MGQNELNQALEIEIDAVLHHLILSGSIPLFKRNRCV